MPQTPNISRVVASTAQRIQDRQRTVRWAFQPPLEDLRLLTPDEQLEQFLKLDIRELQRIRMERGQGALNSYLNAQIKNYLRGQYGS